MPHVLRLLRSRGIQVTAQRLAVLRAVTRLPHGSADAIYTDVCAAIGSISRQSVYDALGTLTAAGILRRIQPAGSPALFDPRVGDAHHHLICRDCGAVADVDCAAGSAPCMSVPAHHGYQIHETEVLYWGSCPSCRAKASAQGS